MIGKRLIAFIIDFSTSIISGIFIYFILVFSFNELINFVSLFLPSNSYIFDFIPTPFITISSIVVNLLWSIGWFGLLWGFTTYKFGTTLGKLVFGLEVTSKSGEALTFAHAIRREFIKFAMAIIPLLGIFLIYQLTYSHETFYDNFFNLSVNSIENQSKTLPFLSIITFLNILLTIFIGLFYFVIYAFGDPDLLWKM